MPPEACAPTVWLSLSVGPRADDGVGSQAERAREAALPKIPVRVGE